MRARFWQGLLSKISILVLVLGLGWSLAASKSVNTFLSELSSGGVHNVELSPNGLARVFPNGKRSEFSEAYTVQLLLNKDLFEALEFARKNFSTKYSVVRNVPTGDYIMIGLQVAGIAILLIMLVILIRSRSGSGDSAGGAMSFGKSRAKQVEKPSTLFKDVAGCEEAKEELLE
ncbi:MAG: hypothetical protein ACK41E_10295, partial [Deinococcales bacterium]